MSSVQSEQKSYEMPPKEGMGIARGRHQPNRIRRNLHRFHPASRLHVTNPASMSALAIYRSLNGCCWFTKANYRLRKRT